MERHEANPKPSEDGGDPEPGLVQGKWLILVMLPLAVVVVAGGFTLIKPRPGDVPAEVNNRPFGPATTSEVEDIPLIRRVTKEPSLPTEGPADE